MTLKSGEPTDDLYQSTPRCPSLRREIARRVTSSWVSLGLPKPAMRSLRALAMAFVCIIAAGAANASSAASRAAARSCPSGNEHPLYTQEGLAAWYSPSALGHRTASGDPTARHVLTAAHPALPFGTVVRVTNLENCRAVKVTINDRGPHSRRGHRRILDVSKPAAAALGMTKGGVVMIKLEEFQSDQPAG
jgi:rare lipoprotein A